MTFVDRETLVKGAIAGIATWATLIMGEADRALGILITLMIIDYISGVLAAWYNKELNSEIGLRGIAKKGLMLLLVIVAHQVDSMLGTQGVTRTAVIWFLAANDGLSIVENASECGVHVPILTQALGALKQKAEGGG